MTKSSLPRAARLAAVLAAGFAISRIVSARLAPPANNGITVDVIGDRDFDDGVSSSILRRRLQSVSAFNDPKTVEAREVVRRQSHALGQGTGGPPQPPQLRPRVNGEGVAASDAQQSLLPPVGGAAIIEATNVESPPPEVEDTAVLLSQRQAPIDAVGNGDAAADTPPAAAAAAQQQQEGGGAPAATGGGGVATPSVIPDAPPNDVRPYNVDNALLTTKGFRYTLFFLVYDSQSDQFVIVHNAPGCNYGCARVFRVASVTSMALRRHFPARFAGAESVDVKGRPAGDFVVMLSTGDAPRISRHCLEDRDHCGSADYAPILQFGSVFVEGGIYPTMIAMPLPVRPHVACFDEWMVTDDVCQDLRPKVDLNDNEVRSGLVFGDQLGLTQDPNYWENLAPQVIWRGTDFQFLHTMFPDLRPPEFAIDLEPHMDTFPRSGAPEDDKMWAIKTLWGMGDQQLLPRWRGVLLTSEAELEAWKDLQRTGEFKLPWINVKFASISSKGLKISPAEHPEYVKLQELGIMAIGERVNMTAQAGYKYHIDLGGGGGTTWTGTIEKLALPGLLFHHVTPTKDWFHDLLVPWQHYVPVNTDLSDLRNKFEWAESHPREAKQIAEQGTQFARWMGSREGFARLYEDYLVRPLGDIVRAYRPLPPRYQGKTLLQVIEERGKELGAGWDVIGRCSGMHSNSCLDLTKSGS